MLEDNEKITISGADAIEALRELEYLLISLNKIAHYYYDAPDSSISRERYIQYAIETTRFIDDNQITRRLAKARRIVSSSFDDELGADDMDDVERAMVDIKYWQVPGD